jgi:E3 SUMO-protein ligase NSE2
LVGKTSHPTASEDMSGRRLLQRRPGGASEGGSSRARQPTTTLPPYQEPSCALSADARTVLRELSINRETRAYEDHVRAAIKNLGEATAGINDSLRLRQERLDVLTSKDDMTPARQAEKERLTEYVDELEPEVTRLTDAAEQSIRDLIDRQAHWDDEKALLAAVYTELETQQAAGGGQGRNAGRRRPRAGNDDEEPDEEPDDADTEMQDAEPPAVPKGPVALLSEGKKAKTTGYAALDAHRRYGLNNDYAAFKKLWHDAAHGDDVPLPNASRWFNVDGQPVMAVRRAGAAARTGDASDHDDDDIVIARETISYKCPLSMADLADPLTSRVCKHSFEKEAIMDFLRSKRDNENVRCPCTGCDKVRCRSDPLDTVAYRRSRANSCNLCCSQLPVLAIRAQGPVPG